MSTKRRPNRVLTLHAPPRVVLTLEWRCPVSACHALLPSEVTIRTGQVWLCCPKCRSRHLAVALRPGADGHELHGLIGPLLAAQAIRRYLPIAAAFDDAQCWPLRLVAWEAPSPAFLFLGPIRGLVAQAQLHDPLPSVLRGLGLTPDAEAA